MILIKYDKYGSVSTLGESDDYGYLFDLLEAISDKYESIGKMCISKEVNDDLTSIYQFASEESGWEFVYMITHGMATDVKEL